MDRGIKFLVLKIEQKAALLPRAGSSTSGHYERTVVGVVGVALANLTSEFFCLQASCRLFMLSQKKVYTAQSQADQ